MSTRRTSTRFAVTLSAGMLFASGAGFAISACSSSTTTPAATDTTDAALDAPRDTNRPAVDSSTDTDSSTTPQTQAECLAACDAKHPNAVAKDNAIGTCWDTNCKGPCVDDPATAFDAGSDAAIDAGPNPLCGTGAQSFSADCDNCTTTFCCTSWAGCFGEMDCSDYDTCLGTCSNLP
ncbi:MAG: hypothetical protein JWO86_4543 [Myxococcaceae bacterium]|jgi:hypothetical protein|nr:hypothetical protein [Myxococcaceae bacterium]MEA2750504.1 hypothetical protein [Myxococcales bacterium]